MADASIYQQYLQPVRSMQDYAADMDRRDLNALQLVGLRRQNEVADLTAQQTREQLAQAAAKRNALQALYANPAMSDPIARENAMLGNPLLAAEGQAAQTARLTAEHLKAQSANQNAQADKNAAAARDDATKRAREAIQTGLNELATMRGPADAMRALQAHAKQGMPQDQLAQVSRELMGISTPEQWQAWQQQTNARLMTAAQRIEAEDKARTAARQATNDAATNANRDLVPDGQGGWRVNEPLVGAKARIAQAGASVTMGTPLAVKLPNGADAFVQPANRPGAAPTILTLPGANGGAVSPPPKQPPVEFTKSVAGLNELRNGLDAYEKVLKEQKGPNVIAMGANRAALQGAYTSLQMGLKNAFELGALAGPDLTLLEGMLADPTSFKAQGLGSKGLAEQIAQAREYLKNRGTAVYQAHGQAIPQEFQGAGRSEPAAPRVVNFSDLK